MSPWCLIENVQMAEGENKLDLHMNHWYNEDDYDMKACLKVFVAEFDPEDPGKAAQKGKTCVKIARFPTGDGEWLDKGQWNDEHVVTLNLGEEWAEKAVSVFVQIRS